MGPVAVLGVGQMGEKNEFFSFSVCSLFDKFLRYFFFLDKYLVLCKSVKVLLEKF